MKWQLVARFVTIGEAETAKSALTAAGIDVVVADEAMVAVNWLYSNAVGGVKLLVPETDADAAAAILASSAEVRAEGAGVAEDAGALTNAAHSEASVPPPISTACPTCGANDAKRVPRLRLFVFFAICVWGVTTAVRQPEFGLAGLLVAAIITALAPKRRCTRCGDSWTVQTAGADQAGAEAAPLPSTSDLIEPRCPRCGSPEYYRINYRRLKAAPLLFSVAALPMMLAWPFLPKWRCDHCGEQS